MIKILVVSIDHMGFDSKATIRIETLMVTIAIQMDFDSNSVVS